jgi:Glyoxalase/Bleomycin resistance protein/Dioxygenase superfamily
LPWPRAHERPPTPQNSRAPDFLAHWVVKTTRTEQMIAWYREVFGGRVIHQGKRIAFIAWDDEHHRIALIKVPRLLRVAFPLARFRRKLYGIDHIAVQFESVERLLVNYERLRRSGISPVWAGGYRIRRQPRRRLCGSMIATNADPRSISSQAITHPPYRHCDVMGNAATALNLSGLPWWPLKVGPCISTAL